MRVLLYEGTSITSKLIKFQTRSKYSHAAVELSDGSVVESWRKGVSHAGDMSENHTPGTPVDAFVVRGLQPMQEMGAEEFLLSQVGKKYDFRGVASFLSRRDLALDDRWFCSELATEAFRSVDIALLERIPSPHVSPAILSYSPILTFDGRYMTK